MIKDATIAILAAVVCLLWVILGKQEELTKGYYRQMVDCQLEESK